MPMTLVKDPTTHEEEETCPEFRFKIVGIFKDALSRQVTDAVKIQRKRKIGPSLRS